jgi:hypothetical protein
VQNHRAEPPERQGWRPGLPATFEQLGNSKVEKLHLTIRSHQYVRRLQVTVDGQVGMCMRHGRQGIEEQPDARSDVELVLITIQVNVAALDVLEDKKRLATRRHVRVNQLRDVGILQAAQNATFAFEPFLAALAISAKLRTFTATRRSNRPSFRSASQTVPIPP